MFRFLYRCALRLHPPGFRERFAGEMLSIFDQAAGKAAAFRLLADGFLSLARQWTLRPEFWHDPVPVQQPVSAGVPSFHTLDPFRPRAAAMIHGLVLSLAVFCLTCFAIRYSWIRVLHVRIPEVQFAAQSDAQSEPRFDARAGTESYSSRVRRPAAKAEAALQQPVLTESKSPASITVLQAPRSSGARWSIKRPIQPPSIPAAVQHNRPEMNTIQNDRAQNSELPKPMAAPTGENLKLEATERRRVIDGAIANLKRYYIHPDIAQKMADALRTHEKKAMMMSRLTAKRWPVC